METNAGKHSSVFNKIVQYIKDPFTMGRVCSCEITGFFNVTPEGSGLSAGGALLDGLTHK